VDTMSRRSAGRGMSLREEFCLPSRTSSENPV
jgi:hypothetical protein